MKKFALAALVAAFSLVGFSAPAYADSPGQLSNSDNYYKVRNVTKNGSYGKSVALECNETVKYSVTLANSEFGLLRDLTVSASLPNNLSASAMNANDQTTSVSGTVNVTTPNGSSLNYVNGSTQLFTESGQLVRTLADGVTAGGVNAGNLNGSTAVFVQFQAKVDCPQPPVKKIQVCELATKRIITIDETAYDASKHSRNLADCADKPAPGEITVCKISTGKIVNIKESDYDESIYTKDLSKCAATPVTPAELPATGPESVLAIAAGYLSVLGAGAAYVVQARRGNLG